MKLNYILIFLFGLFSPIFICFAGILSLEDNVQKQTFEGMQRVFFMGDTYTFEYGDEVQNEYFKNDENIDGFSSLIAVHIFRNYTDPLLVAQSFYDKLSADNQGARLAIHRFSHEPVLTFVLMSEQGLELNFWRFYRNQGENGVLGMQYLKTFKIPQTIAEKERLKTVVQRIAEQFVILPKISFIR